MIRNIVWREGLFMRPQHFQQSSFYMKSELMMRTRLLGANQWGFFDFKIDSSSLAIGKVLIQHISGVMPDGTIFDIRSDEQFLGVDIKDIPEEEVEDEKIIEENVKELAEV